jgi:hypothetical protein
MTSVVQVSSPAVGRRVCLVDSGRLNFLEGVSSAYEVIQQAIASGVSASRLILDLAGTDQLSYDDVYYEKSVWRLLPPFDHPTDPAHCYVTGTGLTHFSSAATRQSMHAVQTEETDSMRMYRWGLEGGRPAANVVGAAPEWFYKGDGSILRAHGDVLTIPSFAEDGGEESEIAGIYLIDNDGHPRRVGFAIGNEFSDHLFERRNYLYLAHSKLRECALGPELVLDFDFQNVPGQVRIERSGETLWEKQIKSGEKNMVHSLANMEHHHFKYPTHRRPGDVHIHFLGADAFSFGDRIALADHDIVEISFPLLGRPLRNTIHREKPADALVKATPA